MVLPYRLTGNPNVVQTLARVGTPVQRLVNLSDEEVKIIRSCISAGANLYYADQQSSIEWWLDDMVTGSAWLLTNTRIFPTQLSAVTGDDPAFTGNTSTDGGGWWSQSTPAINDSLSWQVALRAGMYTLRLTSIKSNADGKVQIYLLGTPQIDADLYSASFVPNFSNVSGSIEVTDDGVYTVTSLVYGKTAASAGYRLGLQYIDLLRTGDA